MLTVPDGIECSYNGYAFNASIRSKVFKEHVTSGDNRTVKYSKITITITGVMTQDDVNAYEIAQGIGVGGTPLDGFMLWLRRKLAVHGKNLVYVNKGYGIDLNVNPNPMTGIRDVYMGPKTGKLTWFPMGGTDGARAAGFEWEVSTCIAECENFPADPGPRTFLEISFTMNYDCDEAGLVTITTNGTAQIPLSLRADNTLPRTIDDSIGFAIRPAPTGFLRRHSRQLSADRAICTFTITDIQQEVPPPDDVVRIEMRHRIRQERPYTPLWNCTISGSIRLSPTAIRSLAIRRFYSIAAQRMSFARRNAIVGIGPTSGIFSGPRGIVLGIVEMEEDLFKNESRFTVNYRMLGAPIDAVARVSGLWRPIVSAAAPPAAGDWNAASWTASLATNAQAFGGLLSARFRAGDEIIIDVCNGPVAESMHTPSVTVASEVDELVAAADAGSDEDLEEGEPNQLEVMDEEDMFPPETSWVEWKCVPRRLVDHNKVRHKPLDGEVSEPSNQLDPFGSVNGVAKDVETPKGTWTTDTDDIIQQIATPTLTLRLTGYGVRIGHRVNQPKLVTYGGRTATLASEDVTEETLGVSEDIVMYRTNWDLVYMIDGPSEMPLPANPVLGIDGE